MFKRTLYHLNSLPKEQVLAEVMQEKFHEAANMIIILPQKATPDQNNDSLNVD